MAGVLLLEVVPAISRRLRRGWSVRAYDWRCRIGYLRGRGRKAWWLRPLEDALGEGVAMKPTSTVSQHSSQSKQRVPGDKVLRS